MQTLLWHMALVPHTTTQAAGEKALVVHGGTQLPVRWSELIVTPVGRSSPGRGWFRACAELHCSPSCEGYPLTRCLLLYTALLRATRATRSRTWKPSCSSSRSTCPHAYRTCLEGVRPSATTWLFATHMSVCAHPVCVAHVTAKPALGQATSTSTEWCVLPCRPSTRRNFPFRLTRCSHQARRREQFRLERMDREEGEAKAQQEFEVRVARTRLAHACDKSRSVRRLTLLP